MNNAETGKGDNSPYLIELFRYAIEHSPHPMIAMDGQSHIIRYANPAFCHLSGHKRANMLGHTFVKILPKTERNHIVTLLDRVYLSHNIEKPIEQEHTSPGGNTSYWTYLAWPVFNEKDERIGMMLQITDTTEAIYDRQRFEQAADEIRAINQQLLISSIREQESAELAVTAQKLMHHAQRMDGIGKLAGGIAHDFNNLLTAILGFTELTSDSLPPDVPVQKYLQTVKKAGERAALLTSQLLAFARKQVIIPKILDINTLTRDIDMMLQRLVGEDIEIVRHTQPDAGMVKVDPNQFSQVLVNLTVNARDAMPEGGRITIKTTNAMLDENYASRHEGVKPGDYAVVAVQDTGTGMTAEVKSHLFEPFYTTKPIGKGTGLGLATCYGIVQQNDGHIEVDSNPEAGTTVRIYLPRVNGIPLPTQIDRSVTLHPRGTETILLVEDETLVRDIGLQALQLQGYTVLGAANGKEALQVIWKHPGKIDLVVTDIIMPVMGGKELADQLHKTHPHLKVLFITGYTDESFTCPSILKPGTAFLHKPFTPVELARNVRDMLDSKSI